MKTFNIDDARKHHELLYLLQEHKKDMEQLMQQLSNMEKQLTDGDDPTEVESDEEIGDEVPGPKAIAEKLDHDNIKVLIEQYLAGEDKLDLLVWEMTELDSSDPMVETEDMLDREQKDDQEHKAYGRDINKCKTLLVGDQGTNKIIRSVKQNHSQHMSGQQRSEAICMRFAKRQFMCVSQHVMKRVKVTDAAFDDKKFQYQNLNRIDEAVRDISMAYGLAAVQEFIASEMLPSKDALDAHEQKHGNHHELLLNLFKDWIEKNSSNPQFQYHCQLITLFGPLRQLYLTSVKCGNGIGREPVWMLMLPLFAQLQKRNYWT
ncbi:Ankyrin repeat domain-containing 12 [Paramuricea clavata]|uniref:Ankyrin repeat domain-containing 12 n=1 Tax=Paramuricea clavata TaxID=317549 RepID=A0A7D9EW54_PARCT|nr:Ankyrin repeat domain-containing 12 [Paramuricea clavata]